MLLSDRGSASESPSLSCRLGSLPGRTTFSPVGELPRTPSSWSCGSCTVPKHSPRGHRAWSGGGSAGILLRCFLTRARGEALSAHVGQAELPGPWPRSLGGSCAENEKQEPGSTWEVGNGVGRRVSLGAQLPGSPEPAMSPAFPVTQVDEPFLP